MSAITAFIVDDEPLARRHLLHLLRDDTEIKVVGIFDSAAAAAREARELVPRLILLDVRMPELDGFELVSTLAAQGLNPYVIFVTARSERALDAFDVGAVDYLLKPFDKARFARAIARAKTLLSGVTPGAPDQSTGSEPRRTAGRNRLLVSDRGNVQVLAMSDIEFAQAAGRHVKIHARGQCYTYRQPMRELEQRLDPALFVRIHRSTLVNVEHIAEVHPLFHGDCELVTRRGTRLTLSRRYRNRLAPFLL
ncbi:MAG TPA: LytTR family DNA-binding domain-containing protein [Steroidobacteraceae bacterium]|nr:LytTR family DNA-binding domain-containing protein [Steroidobacteraceae bacterium]